MHRAARGAPAWLKVGRFWQPGSRQRLLCTSIMPACRCSPQKRAMLSPGALNAGYFWQPAMQQRRDLTSTMPSRLRGST